MIKKKYLASAIVALLSVGVLSGCSARTKDARFARPGDNLMTCADIAYEFAANESQLKTMMPRQAWRKVTNAIGVTNPRSHGVNTPEQIDLLHNRNALLYKNAVAKKCPTLHSKLNVDYKIFGQPMMK